MNSHLVDQHKQSSQVLYEVTPILTESEKQKEEDSDDLFSEKESVPRSKRSSLLNLFKALLSDFPYAAYDKTSSQMHGKHLLSWRRYPQP